MPRQLKKMPTVQNVVKGGQASVTLPIGPTYDKVTFKTNIPRADMKNIRVEVNGKPIQEYDSATQLQLVNTYYDRGDSAGYVTIHFNRPELDNFSDARLAGLGTLDVSTLSVLFDIDAATAVTPTCECWAMRSEPTPLGAIVKVRPFQSGTFGVGQNEIDNIPRAAPILAMHLFNANITDVEVDVDSMRVTEGPKELIEVLQKEAKRAPYTSAGVCIDYTLEGDIRQALRVRQARDFRIRPTLSSSGAVRTLVEYLDGFAGI